MSPSSDHILKVAVFTGTRAEYGLLRHLVKSLIIDSSFELHLLVSGTHLSGQYGSTVSEIHQDGIQPSALIPLDFENEHSMAALCSQAMAGVSNALAKLGSQLLILLGDRYETFAAAAAAHLHGIRVIHLHGGETTLGAVDDKLRHAISQLSSIHFTAAEPYRQRVISMGHSPQRVMNIGPMALDGLYSMKTMTREEFELSTGFKFANRNILVTYHPETLLDDNGISGFQFLLEALRQVDCNVLFTHPNADLGSSKLLLLLKNYVASNPSNSFDIPSLGQNRYLNALFLFDALAGNTSSGIIEAPLVGCPVLNIGDRQKGRLRSGTVVDVPISFDQVLSGLHKILTFSRSELLVDTFVRNPSSRPSMQIINWLNIHRAELLRPLIYYPN